MAEDDLSSYIQADLFNETENKLRAETAQVRRLHEGLAPYLDAPRLRRLVAEQGDIYQALREPVPPEEIRALLDTLAAILRPRPREQIKSPADIAGLLMVEMGKLQQEELRTVLLDTKNRVQSVETIYRGSLNTALIRVGEVFKPAIQYNSSAMIVCHNHPSSDVTPSPEDVLVTRQIIEAGKLLDVDILDHIIVSSDKWLSMRERNLGFNK